MYLATVWISAIIMMLGSIWYCYLILKNKVQPPPATFIILSFTFPLAFYMYAQKPGWSYTANIGLTTAIASVWLVAIFLIGKLLYERRLHIEVNKFQRATIIASALIIGFWFISKDQLTSYILLQVSALISYIPVVKNLSKAEKNKDSLIFWISLFLSTCVACYAAYERNDLQSWIYIGRALPSTLTVVILMIRIEIRKAYS